MLEAAFRNQPLGHTLRLADLPVFCRPHPFPLPEVSHFTLFSCLGFVKL